MDKDHRAAGGRNAAAGAPPTRKKREKAPPRYPFPTVDRFGGGGAAGDCCRGSLLPAGSPVDGQCGGDGQQTAIFGIRSIDVEGDTRYTDEEIISARVCISARAFSASAKSRRRRAS